MIDRAHGLPITRQAGLLGMSRGSVYYLPRPVSAADLALMRKLDELHLEHPFMGARMLRDQLARQGIYAGRRHIRTLMLKMGIGEAAQVQRCRTHKVRNVTERLPRQIAAQVKSVMHAAYKAVGEGRHGRAQATGSLAEERILGCRGEYARGIGRDVHRQPPEAVAFVDALSLHHQHHRESERCGASCQWTGVPLSRRRDGIALDSHWILES